MKLFWCVLSLAGAFVWFSAACGFFAPSPWLATFAFAALGVGSVINAMKELVS